MGYSTDFTGSFALTPELSARQLAVLNRFADTRHENYENEAKPGRYCQWVPDEEGTCIQWDGNEKFDEYIEWIKYLILVYFEPWGIKLNGVVQWEGEEQGDVGKIEIVNNVVTIKKARLRFD